LDRERIQTFSRWSEWSAETVNSVLSSSFATDLPWLISASRNSWWHVCRAIVSPLRGV